MQSKVLIAAGVIVLLLAGCSTPRPETVPPVKQTSPSIAPRVNKTSPTLTSAARPRPMNVRTAPSQAAPATTADVTNLVRAKSTWIEKGRSLVVTRNTSGQPVPLFRQAIVLAEVRATLAKATARPQAEFLRGQLTLKFSRGTPAQIADAINRTISIPEVQKLVVFLPG